MAIKKVIQNSLPGLFKVLSATKLFGYRKLVAWQRKGLPAKLKQYYQDSSEMAEILSFTEKNGVEMIPYFYTEPYRKEPVEIVTKEGFKVVHVEGNEIYFPPSMPDDYIRQSVRVAKMEQDERSPHRYLPVKSMSIGGDAAVLCGASDGIYALQIINKFKKIFLFEANPVWIEPIKKTLKNYLHKIEIVPYYVSDYDSESTITLDTFFSKRNHVLNYLQADIEGSESSMLKGATKLLMGQSDISLAICCYHTGDQERSLREQLTLLGFKVTPSDGYLIVWTDFPIKPPYLRKGVLYAVK